MICLGPRVPGEIVGPRPLSGVVVRPLNFTVRRPEVPRIRFAITGVVSPDVGATLDAVANPFAEQLRSRLSRVDASCPLILLVYAPIILPATLGAVDSDSEASLRTRTARVSENIGYEAWMAAARSERLHLYAAGLKAGIMKLDDELLPPRFRTELLEAVDATILKLKISVATSDV